MTDEPAQSCKDDRRRTNGRDEPEGLLSKASKIVRRVGHSLSDFTGLAPEPLVDAGQAAVLRQAKEFHNRAKALHFPEDPQRILAGSAYFQPLQGCEPALELQSLAWRGDAMLGLSAAGVIALEDEIIDVTRRIFHDDLRHQALSERLFATDWDAVHGFMDTIPGSTVRGGGIVHRLEHGHDFAAAQQIYGEHGLPGALAWFQHVTQDAMTPVGAPIPVGGRRLAEWLVEEGIATKGNAAYLVSFNVAEIAAGFLGAVFMLRLAALLPEIQRRRRVRHRLERAAAAWEAEDLDSVIANYSEARSLAGNGEPAIDLALGWAYTAVARPMAESFLAFRSAAEGLAADDHTLEVDGMVISLRGTAYLMALSQSIQVLDLDHLQGAWRSELTRMVRGGIASFESLAIAQDERFTMELGDRRIQFWPRPLSAAANYYLAARIAAATPFLPVSGELERLGGRALDMLGRATQVHGDIDGLADVQDRWSKELALRNLPAPS